MESGANRLYRAPMATDQELTAHDAHATSSDDGQPKALPLGPFGAVRGEDGRYTRAQVWLKSLTIFFYVFIATVWFPSYLMEPNSLAIPRDLYRGLMSASTWSTILSLIVSGVWFGALAVALYGLRFAQKRDLI